MSTNVLYPAPPGIVGNPQQLRTLHTMSSCKLGHIVAGMATSKEHRPPDETRLSLNLFADLRRRNERAAQKAEMRAERRERQVEQAIRTQRQQRIHQAR